MRWIRILFITAAIWSGAGFVATNGSLHSQARQDLPPTELKQQIEAFDKRVLLKGIFAWTVIGLLSLAALTSMIPKALTRSSILINLALVILFGISIGLCFALWYFPNKIDLSGTSGIMADQNYRVLVCCVCATIAALATYGNLLRQLGVIKVMRV